MGGETGVNGNVVCRWVDGRGTLAVGLEATNPLKFLTLQGEAPGVLWVYGLSFGGGLVCEDFIRIQLAVEPRARVVFTTQASTKVYRMKRAGVSETKQFLNASVASDAMLLVLPDPVVCFADARYRQHQVLDLAQSASLLFVDTVTCGRMANGEVWDFESYTSHLFVRREHQLIWRESLELSNLGEGLSVRERMADYKASTTVLIIGPRMAPAAESVLRTVSQMEIGRKMSAPQLLMSASQLEGVEDPAVVLRMAAYTTMQLEDGLRQLLASPLRDILGEDPFERKR